MSFSDQVSPRKFLKSSALLLGPEVIFQKAPPAANFSPFAGLQFFGQVDIDARTAVMTVALKDLSGASVFSQKLQP
jgi:alkaline phosphatase D